MVRTVVTDMHRCETEAPLVAARPAPCAWRRVVTMLMALVTLAAFLAGAQPAHAEERWSDLDGYKLSEVTLVGSHNPFEQSHYQFLPDALNHSQVIELDLWSMDGHFKVAHSFIDTSSWNNCYNMGHGGRSQDFRGCIDNLRQWHDRYPNHPLVIVKLEIKGGFPFAGPGTLDNHLSGGDNPRLTESMLFRPIDLMTRPSGARFATLDEAAQANNWPTMAQLRGKFMFYVVDGTFGEGMDAAMDYGGRVFEGKVDHLNAFPAFLYDGRTNACMPGLGDTSLPPCEHYRFGVDPRPDTLFGRTWKDWMVVFDTQYSRVRDGQIDTAWHYDRHYFLAMSLDDGGLAAGESRAQAIARLSSKGRASAVNTDWAREQHPFAKARGEPSYRPGEGPIFESSAGLLLRHEGAGRCLTSTGLDHSSMFVGNCPPDGQARRGTRPGGGSNSVVLRANGQISLGGDCIASGPALSDCTRVTPDNTWNIQRDGERVRLQARRDTSQCLGLSEGAPAMVPCADPAARWIAEGFSDLEDLPLQIQNPRVGRCWSVERTTGPLGDPLSSGWLELAPCATPPTPGQTFRHDPLTGQIKTTFGGSEVCLQVFNIEDSPRFDARPTGDPLGVTDRWMNGHIVVTQQCDAPGQQQRPSQRFAYSKTRGHWLGVNGKCLGLYRNDVALRVQAFHSCHPGEFFVDVKHSGVSFFDGGYSDTWEVRPAAPLGVALAAPADNALVRGPLAVRAELSNAAGAATVRFVLNGATLLATDDAAPFETSISTTTLPDGEHTLTAAATDQTGRQATSPPVRIKIDNTAPAVNVTAPSGGAVVRAAIVARANATDAGTGVAAVQFALDGQPLGGSIGAAPYETSLDTKTIADGPHTLTATAADAAGNEMTAAPVQFVVDNTPPSAAMASPADNALVRGSVTLDATAADTLSGVQKVEFLVDGQVAGTAASVTSPSLTLNSAALADGEHLLAARATDLAGNVTTSAPVRLRVDNTVPAVQITSPADGAARAADALTVRATASDNYSGVASVRFLLDGATSLGTATATPYQASLSVAGLPEGEHLLTAIVADAAGNQTTSAPVRVRVDNTRPTVRLTAPEPRPGTVVFHTSPIVLRAEASDGFSGVASVRFVLDGTTVLGTDTAAPYEVTIDAVVIPNGAHTLTVIAVDEAGNESAPAVPVKINATPAR